MSINYMGFNHFHYGALVFLSGFSNDNEDFVTTFFISRFGAMMKESCILKDLKKIFWMSND